MDDLSGLRWLARDVEPELASASPELPPPQTVREIVGQRPVRDYICWWARHPDPTGAFASKTRWLRLVPDPIVPRILLFLGYEGLIYRDGPEILGHLFYQRRGDTAYCFSAGVAETLTGRGYATLMQLDFVALAVTLPGIRRARIGRRGSPVPRRALAAIHQHEERLGWRVDLDGWIDFTVNIPAASASNTQHE